MPRRRIAESTIHRLSLYYRTLAAAEQEGNETISSREFARRERLTPAQVRKDLSFFGTFGTRGLGYPVAELQKRIGGILGLNRTWKVALVGAGNIGSALVAYKEFARQGFKIVQVYDNDQRKIGSKHKGVTVLDVRHLASRLGSSGVEIVIIAVPAAVAQKVVDDVIRAGIKAILNFAPVQLKVPEDVYLRNENMSMELEYLSFALVNNHTQRRRPGKSAR